VLSLLAISPIFAVGFIGPDRPCVIPSALSLIYDTDQFVDITVAAAYRPILVSCLESLNTQPVDDANFLEVVNSQPTATADLFNLIVGCPAGHDALALASLFLSRDNFLKPIVDRFLGCCILTKNGFEKLKGYSAMALLAVFDEPPLSSAAQRLTLEGMRPAVEAALQGICSLYEPSLFGGRRGQSFIVSLRGQLVHSGWTTRHVRNRRRTPISSARFLCFLWDHRSPFENISVKFRCCALCVRRCRAARRSRHAGVPLEYSPPCAKSRADGCRKSDFLSRRPSDPPF
jgi:hypothetical protein